MKYQTVTRTVYNIIDALTETGGFATVITLAFYILTTRVEKVLFFQEITSKLFKFYEASGQKYAPKKKAKIIQQKIDACKPFKPGFWNAFCSLIRP